MHEHFKLQIDSLASPTSTLFYGLTDSSGYRIKSIAYCADIGLSNVYFDSLEFDGMNGSIPNFK